jgi:uncharacterized damage-inducible protein DinB
MPDMLDAVLQQLAATHDGDPWYGSSRTRLLEGINAKQASAVPIQGGHSIWEQVLHMTSWTREVTRRVRGAEPGSPVEGDWPVPETGSEPEWEAARAGLATAHRDLIAALREQPESRWSQPVGLLREPAHGTGLTVFGMVVGLAQHDAYHTGQLATLRRALGLL